MRALRDACGRIGEVGLLAGSAACLLAVPAVWAQSAQELPTRQPGVPTPMLPSELPKRPRPPPPPPPGDDGLGQDGFYLEADTLVRDDKNNVWTARGQVEARYKGHVIRGDEIVYHVATGTVTVSGHAQIINPDGTSEAAGRLMLDDKLRAGFAQGFSAQESDNIHVAAGVAIRRSETVNELDRAVFTPCTVCAANGSPKTPTWSIRATKVIEDHTRHVVYYRNAVIEVKGIPVFYAPVFWHPDPESTRASGLLIPSIAVTNKRGLSYQQAYYVSISPSQELYITPQINTKVAPLLNVEYDQKFYSGEIDIRGGYTYERDFNSDGQLFGALTSRSYVLARGAFNLTSDWSWGFAAERTSDRYLFEKYDTSNVYQYQGQFNDPSQQLISDLYATRQDSTSYLSISTLSFQGLRPTDENRTFPLVAPLVEYLYEPSGDILGGRLQLSGSGVLLNRDQSPVDPLEPGIDSRRATGEVDWLRSFTLSDGMRFEPFIDLREDVYGVSDSSSTDTGQKIYDRSVDNLGLNFSWPFIRQGDGTTIILEPIAQLLIAPKANDNPNIPNEDSQVFTFDESNLFSINKFAGYDLVDGGDRLNAAGRATVDWGDGENAQIMVGRTFRAQPTNIYPVSTGLDGDASDWVVAGDTTPFPGVSFYGRALVSDRAQIETQEYGVDLAYSNARGYLRYDADNTQPGGKTANVEAAGEFFFTKNWGVSAVGVRDLDLEEWRQIQLGVIYKDDCIRVEVVYQHQDTITGALSASDSVFVRLTLATLGDQGYSNGEFR